MVSGGVHTPRRAAGAVVSAGSPHVAKKKPAAQRGFLETDDPIARLNALERRVRDLTTDLHQLIFEVRRSLLRGGAAGVRGGDFRR